MIEAFTYETVHEFEENALASQHRLRYRAFIERQSYAVPSYQKMEYDQYDTPATVYLVWRHEEDKSVAGIVRLLSTECAYMLKDLWPHLVSKEPLPSSPHILEVTRFCVDKSLPPAMRQHIKRELVCGMIEYALERDVHTLIGVMQTLLWRSVIVQSGGAFDAMGEVQYLEGGYKVLAGKVSVSEGLLQSVRRESGFTEPVLRLSSLLDV